MIDAALRDLLRDARAIHSERELTEILQRVLRNAQTRTDARYAALGILRPGSGQLARFHTLGVDEETKRLIGSRPTNRGVLGDLIRDGVPLRLADVSAHPHSYGAPTFHPKMASFLGAPIFVSGRAQGSLFVTEKRQESEFSEPDEARVVLLADVAGVAIDCFECHRREAKHADALSRTSETLDATAALVRSLAIDEKLHSVLELVAKRGRALLRARATLVALVSGEEIIAAAGAGDVHPALLGSKLDEGEWLLRHLRSRTAPQRFEDAIRAQETMKDAPFLRSLQPQAGLIAPLTLNGRLHGLLLAVDRLEGGPRFTDGDMSALKSFSATAAAAIVTAGALEAKRRPGWR